MIGYIQTKPAFMNILTIAHTDKCTQNVQSHMLTITHTYNLIYVHKMCIHIYHTYNHSKATHAHTYTSTQIHTHNITHMFTITQTCTHNLNTFCICKRQEWDMNCTNINIENTTCFLSKCHDILGASLCLQWHWHGYEYDLF